MADVIVVGGYAPSLIRFRAELLRQMTRSGHTVTAVAPGGTASLRRQLDDIGVDFVDLGAERAGSNPIADVWYCLRLFRLFRRGRPDLVLSYTIKPNVYATVAARIARVSRVFCLVSGLGFAFATNDKHASPSRSIARFLLRRALRSSDGVILQNPDDRDELLRDGALRDTTKTIVVGGSGVDLTEFEQQPVPMGAPSFLLIARLLVAKGVRDYAEAARRVRREAPDARFHLVGWFDDDASSVRREEVEDWQRQDILEYHGPMDDVRPWLARCSAYVLPSYYREGTPRSVLEAMATGRAIVTTNLPGCRETVRDGVNGYLVPPQDPAALAAALEKFIDDPGCAASMGAQSRQMAEEQFDARRVARDMLHFLGLNQSSEHSTLS